jgi:serine/threonine protein kinase/Flp pilus assembly protein TadD
VPDTPNVQLPALKRDLRSVFPFAADERLSATVAVDDHLPFPVQNPAHTPPPVADLSRSVVGAESEKATPPATMPQPGETFLGFRLIEELGRGSFARVFLARQEALAGRLVALKVTHRPTREAEKLARLQHTNVVPVYSVHSAPPVQLICMPFLGRRTIADLLHAHRKSYQLSGFSTRGASPSRRGSTTVGLRPGSRQRDTPPPYPRPTKPTSPAEVADAPALIGSPRAVLEVLGQLADGLAHAHARGILHLDLKPGNVLLADSGEPMLLDFNLSFDTTDPTRELVGGTVPYMALEQLRDLKTRGKGDVDARADLYSLGVMAFEMLTGTPPFPSRSKALADYDGLLAARENGPPPLRSANPAVTPAVESIVRKLLAPKPADRYQSATDLKEDVQRHLNNYPLRFAPDRSIPERLRKWRRRNPRTLFVAGLAAVVAVAIGFGTEAYQLAENKANARAVTQANHTREVLARTRLDLVLPGDPVARNRGAARAVELLQGYGLPDDPGWRQNPVFRRLDPTAQAAVAGDLGELLLLLANVRHADATASARPVAIADAARLNQRAAECFTGLAAPPFLGRQRAELAAAATRETPPPEPPGQAADPRADFLEAVREIRDARYVSAARHLEEVVARQPNHAAAQFCLAFCRQHLGQYDRALERYDLAWTLLPDDVRPVLMRGKVFVLQRKFAEAEVECSRALGLNPTSGEAAWTRAVARKQLGKIKEAEADLGLALVAGRPPLRVYAFRAEVRDGLKDAAGAAADRKAVVDAQPQNEEDFSTRGRARLRTDPAGALADFRAMTGLNPKSLVGLQNQAHVLTEHLGDNAGALEVFSRLAAFYPEYATGRVGKAIVLARLGRRDEAHGEAAQAGRLSNDPAVTYRRACVYALTSKTHAGDRQTATGLLRQAIRDGYWKGYWNPAALEGDDDLAAIRSSPEFQAVLAAAKALSP